MLLRRVAILWPVSCKAQVAQGDFPNLSRLVLKRQVRFSSPHYFIKIGAVVFFLLGRFARFEKRREECGAAHTCPIAAQTPAERDYARCLAAGRHRFNSGWMPRRKQKAEQKDAELRRTTPPRAFVHARTKHTHKGGEESENEMARLTDLPCLTRLV